VYLDNPLENVPFTDILVSNGNLDSYGNLGGIVLELDDMIGGMPNLQSNYNLYPQYFKNYVGLRPIAIYAGDINSAMNKDVFDRISNFLTNR